jgi:hypothetical protein
MPLISLKPVIECLRDAATEPNLWPEALPLISEAFDAGGASCFSCNDRTGGVEWAYIHGRAAEHKKRYVEYYATYDLYLPILSAATDASWATLSESLPEIVLRHSEWYQDFVRPCGISDVTGIHLHHAGPRHLFFGVQWEGAPRLAADDPALHLLLTHLKQAAQSSDVQRTLNLRTSLGSWVLDHLNDALFVAYAGGRIVEMNSAAERILAGSHALTVRHGRLVATDAVENAHLSALFVGAGLGGTPNETSGRILIGRVDARYRLIVTVIPLRGALSSDEHPLVVIRVANLLDQSSPATGLRSLFGLSPAEERLSHGLMRGRTLQELTVEFGVQMPTLRVQLRSVLRKCGVQRQVDLLQVLFRAV